MANLIRVVLVDDDALVRQGLRLILGSDPELTVAGEACDGQAALAVVKDTQPDVTLMDMHMPRMDGLTAMRHLLLEQPSRRIIALTTFDADEYIVPALAAGAGGFLLKDTKPAQIVSAIRAVAAGEPMLSPKVTARLIDMIASNHGDLGGGGGTAAGDARKALAVLSDREKEVAYALGRGLSNADIGHCLYMSVATIKAHVGRILSKLRLENRTQIALLVREAGEPG